MYDVGIMGNGALAGLVAITSGTSTIEPWGAIIVGFVAGALYILGSKCSVWFKVRQPLASRSSNECLIGSFTHLISREMAGKESMRVSLSPPPSWLLGCSPASAWHHCRLLHWLGTQGSQPLIPVSMHAWIGACSVLNVGE